MERRTFLGAAGAAAQSLGGPAEARAQAAGPEARPNVVLIYADDLGYGDLGVYGHPEIRTPHLDRMAAEGVKFTNFYSASSLCTPSRAALMTGRYPIRSGLVRVLFPREEFGIADSEVTLPQILREQGYRTGCIGKWHLGDLPRYYPTRHGFDEYFGLLYSNNMDPRYDHELPWPCPLSLYRNEKAIETPPAQEMLTRRYAEEAVRFINDNKSRRFFLYLAHAMPHTPWFSSPAFQGKSRYGPYGDAVEEIDWGMGEILRALRESGLDRNTLVIFASDNGGTRAGSNGLLRGGKGSTWEGGFRVPCLARWPGRIPAGTLRQDLACTMDLFRTIAELGGGAVPQDRPVDGLNIWTAMNGTGTSPRREIHYFNSTMDSDVELLAIRSGDWKLHFREEEKAGAFEYHPTALYNLARDPSERDDLAPKHPDLVKQLRDRARELVAGIEPGTRCPPLADHMLRAGARKRREARRRK